MRGRETADKEYIDRLKDIDFEPIFILGLHRSGTSILYKILASTHYFNIVTAYHIIYYDSLIYNHLTNREERSKEEFNNLLRRRNQIDRVIDKLKVSADFPEEYGFLLNRTIPSRINRKNLDLFVEMCKKIQFISDKEKPILLKNPWDFSNFMFIKKALPHSRFIFIHRHPLKIVNSSMNTLRILLEERSVYSEMLSDIVRRAHENPLIMGVGHLLTTKWSVIGLIILTEFLAGSTRYFVKNINRLRRGKDYIEIKYEELCKDPDKTIANILEFLDMKPCDRSFRKFIKPRKLDVSEDIKALRNYIYARMKPYFLHCGYEVEYKEI